MLTRYDRLLLALQDAGERGLTHRRVRDIAGKDWKRVIADLEADGAILRRVRGDYVTSAGFQWLVMAAPPRPPEEQGEASVTPLFQPPAGAPVSAIDPDLPVAPQGATSPVLAALRQMNPSPGTTAVLQLHAGSTDSYARLVRELAACGGWQHVHHLDVVDDDAQFPSSTWQLPNGVRVLVLGPPDLGEAA